MAVSGRADRRSSTHFCRWMPRQVDGSFRGPTVIRASAAVDHPLDFYLGSTVVRYADNKSSNSLGEPW
jgi:hypothetical protein